MEVLKWVSEGVIVVSAVCLAAMIPWMKRPFDSTELDEARRRTRIVVRTHGAFLISTGTFLVANGGHVAMYAVAIAPLVMGAMFVWMPWLLTPEV